MKHLLTLSFLFAGLSLSAQYSSAEIRKFKINKITKFSSAKGSAVSQKTETWFDENGNDTAEYNDGSLFRRTVYEYNGKGLPISRTRFGADNKESETATYTYNPDGSFEVSNTDKSFGMTDLTFIDKAGKTIKTVSPDKSEKIYSYDSKGHLQRIKSKGTENGEVLIDQQFSYNGAGQLTKAVSKGDYKWTQTYTYDRKGLLIKSKLNSITDGVADPEITFTYKYEFRK